MNEDDFAKRIYEEGSIRGGFLDKWNNRVDQYWEELVGRGV